MGLSSSTLWALIRHPTLLDMLVKERDTLRGLPPLPAVLAPKGGAGLGGGAGTLPGTPTGVAGASPMYGTPSGKRGVGGTGGAADSLPLDVARRQEEMGKVQQLLVELMTSTATYLHSPQVRGACLALLPCCTPGRALSASRRDSTR